MGKNSKPILSVLVDENKKERFADLARRHKYSMGWLVNDAIDRMLAADSIDIYINFIGNIENSPKFDPVGISREDIEELIKNSIGNLDIEELIKPYTHTVDTPSIGNLEIEAMVKSSLANLNISSTGIDDVEKLIRTSIEIALEPIEAEIEELKKLDAIG